MQRHESLSAAHGSAEPAISEHRHSRRPRRALFAALLSVACVACGGVTRFEDTTPITLRSPAPPPAPEPKRVEVKNDHIEIGEKIQFALDKADILPESHGLLNEVVEVLKGHVEIKKLDIIGHTDSDGADTYNQSLSEKRAKSVLTYLVQNGVTADRLSSQGKGETAPVADNTTAAGREKNRRVEFLIVQQEGNTP